MKNKQNGFTLIELILSMTLSAILAGVVVEIIAGPIRSYFWYAERSAWVDMAQTSLESIEQDLKQCLPSSVKVSNDPKSQILSFRNILYKGFVLPHEKPYVPEEINAQHQREQLYVVFPSNNDTLHPLQPQLLNNFADPVPYYIVGNLTQYDCLAKDHVLERVSFLTDDAKQTALLTNQVMDCQFTMLSNKSNPSIVVSLTFGRGHSQVSLTQPISVGHE